MSATIKYMVNNAREIPLLRKRIQKTAFDLSIGVFFHNKISVPHSDEVVIFDVGDTWLYDNCENLLKPWWFFDCSTEEYLENMGKLAKMAEVCLPHGDVHIFISEYEDGAEYEECRFVKISSFVEEIAEIYVSQMFGPPGVTTYLRITE